jgi:hypothetical protein
MRRKMRKSLMLVIGTLLLVFTGSAIRSEAEVTVRINLPAIRLAAPPKVNGIKAATHKMNNKADINRIEDKI